jgi:hypothetical protein
MKKKLIIMIFVLVLAIFLTACGSKSSATNVTSDTNVPDNSTGNVALPLQTQLIVGTFVLEKSDFAVTKDQAQELLPLWKVLKNLLGSDSSSSIEINALVDQIQDTMTEEQKAYLNDQGITMETYQSVLSEYLPDVVQPGNFGNMTDEERQAMRETAVASGATGPGGGGFGQMPAEMQGAGGVPGMGPGGEGQLLRDGAVSSTPRSSSGGRAGGFGGGQMNVTMIEALIELLSSK